MCVCVFGSGFKLHFGIGTVFTEAKMQDDPQPDRAAGGLRARQKCRSTLALHTPCPTPGAIAPPTAGRLVLKPKAPRGVNDGHFECFR